MEGVPAHLAACGILIIHVLACTQLSVNEPKPKSERARGLASDRFKLKNACPEETRNSDSDNRVCDLAEVGIRPGIGKGDR